MLTTLLRTGRSAIRQLWRLLVTHPGFGSVKLRRGAYSSGLPTYWAEYSLRGRRGQGASSSTHVQHGSWPRPCRENTLSSTARQDASWACIKCLTLSAPQLLRRAGQPAPSGSAEHRCHANAPSTRTSPAMSLACMQPH